MSEAAPPAAYGDWLPLLERFRDGDDSVLSAMQNGTLEWTGIVAERWTARLGEAFRVRLENISRRLQTALDRDGADPFSVSQAMVAARRALSPLRTAAMLAFLPEEVRKYFAEQVERFASQTQESLESSAMRIRTDGGVMLKTLRDHSLTAVVSRSAQSESEPEPPSTDVRRRRVLL